jgi:acyl-coenzyme A synthetase/AMP-(fatty) acid ligase/3-hydroxymyristoyl/3-hydroxydecanoyl-(acyl carrier protein) dehydratase
MTERVDILSVGCAPCQPHASLPAGAIVGWRGSDEVTLASWQHRMRQWQRRFEAQAGQRVALYIEDSLEFAAALYGAWHAGKTVVLPADILPATCAGLRAHVDLFAGDYPVCCTPLQLPADFPAAPPGNAPLIGSHPGLVIFTSGSTGQPQPIPKYLRQLAAEVATLEAVFGAEIGTAEVIATVSHQHIYGLLFKVLWPLATGRPIHAVSLLHLEQLARPVARRDCVLVTSPAYLKRLPATVTLKQAAQWVRAIFSSGGPLALADAEATAQLLGRAPIEVYGSSETGGIAYRQRQFGFDEPGNCGGNFGRGSSRDSRCDSSCDSNCDSRHDDAWRLLPNVTVQPSGPDALLSVRSPHLADDTWFETADRVEMIADGGFVLRGRADRVVKIEEKRISLDAIESGLLRSPLVAQARVAVAPGRRDEIAAFVVLSGSGQDVLRHNGQPALNRMLREALAGGVERVALPRRWRYLDALPVNQQGKTPQALLLALLGLPPANARPTEPGMQILEQDANRVLIELHATANLACFDGHFPGTPILPGIAQVEWAWTLAQRCFASPMRFAGMQALKFHCVIRPDAKFQLELLRDAGGQSVAFRYFSAAGKHASGKLLCGGADVV